MNNLEQAKQAIKNEMEQLQAEVDKRMEFVKENISEENPLRKHREYTSILEQKIKNLEQALSWMDDTTTIPSEEKQQEVAEAAAEEERVVTGKTQEQDNYELEVYRFCGVEIYKLTTEEAKELMSVIRGRERYYNIKGDEENVLDTHNENYKLYNNDIQITL